MRSPTRSLLLLPLLALLVVPAHGDEPPGEQRAIDLPFGNLVVREGAALAEGERGLDAAFPYVRGLGPATLDRFVAPIGNEHQAIEAVRLFVAGPLVTKKQAARIVAVAKSLRDEFEHLQPTIEDHEPKEWGPVARHVDRDPGGPKRKAREECWEVSLVAFEMDRILRLVHVTAKVDPKGKVVLERHAIVSGPMTSWQTGVVADDEKTRSREAEVERAMRDEARRAREAYAAALRPPRNAANAWAFARMRLSVNDLRALWGDAEHSLGSGLLIQGWDLDDGTTAVFASSGWGHACHGAHQAPRPPGKGARRTFLRAPPY